MTTVSGKLSLVTSQPARVTQVLVRATEDRVHGADVTVDENDTVPVSNGAVSMNLQPGPAVMTLLNNGRMLKTVPLYVAPSGSQSLGNAVQQAEVLEGRERSELEALMRQVSAQVASVTSTTRWSGDRLVVNGKTSPPLTGPQGAPGAGNTTTVKTEAEAQKLTGLPKGHKVYVVDTGTWYEEG